MKTNNRLYLLAVTTAAMSLSASTSIGQVFNAEDVINNRAVAASPRAKEEFPWLARPPASRAEACCDQGEVKNKLTDAKRNRGYWASPRVREMFPELASESTPRREFTTAPLIESNAGFRSSPRAKENFPELRFLSPVTTKGGASKLMEWKK